MKTVSVTEFKAHCLQLLEEARQTGESIEVLKRGKRLATVTPALPEADYRPGQFKNDIKIVGDIIEPISPAENWNLEREWF